MVSQRRKLLGDSTTDFLWGDEGEIEMPEFYLLLRKLRLYCMSWDDTNSRYEQVGRIPFLEPGGYLDQPYLASMALEAAMIGEQRYKEYLSYEQSVSASRLG